MCSSKRVNLLFLLLLFFLTSCGYKFGYGDIPDHYRKISIPFVEGDATGAFTSTLIHTVVASGAFTYDTKCPDLILRARILDYKNESIGFRYDRDENNIRTKELVPSETRRSIRVEIVLVDARRGCTVAGPDVLIAMVDFDHEFNSSRDGVNVFSLGQVTDIDEAIDAANSPLNRAIARKIVNYLMSAW